MESAFYTRGDPNSRAAARRLDYMNADEHTFNMHAVNKLTIKEELPKLPLLDGSP